MRRPPLALLLRALALLPLLTGAQSPDDDDDDDFEKDEAGDALQPAWPRPGAQKPETPEQIADFLATPPPTLHEVTWSASPEFDALVGLGRSAGLAGPAGAGSINLAARRWAPNGPGEEANITMRSFAYEGGVWVPERNEVWFTSEINKPPAYVFTLDLETNTVRAPALSRELVNPAGGFYFDGTLYFTEWGNRTTGARPGIVAIDPVSGQVTTLVDKFEDRRLNGPDDIAVVRDGNRTLLYFTDPDFATFFRIQGPPEGPDATYRLDLDTGELIRVVSARQLDPPNGVCFSPDGRTAYVSQTPFAPRRNRVNGGVKAIFAFDVTENELRNMRPFGEKARKGVPDGLKCDDEGRVWAAEGEGIVVRNSGGEILGGFKADGLKKGITRKTDVANFALAGDELVVLALDQIVRVKLARVVMSPERFR